MQLIRHIFHSLRSIPSLGGSGAIKLLLARYSASNFCIRPRNYPAPIAIRGKTSDAAILYSIIVRREYDLTGLTEVNQIIDAGANIGVAAVFFAHAFPDAKITSIEPECSNFDLLKKNTAHLANISTIRAALWTSHTPLVVVNSKSEKWCFQYKIVTNGEQGEVEGIPLEDLVGNGIDLLKIDIEGGEKEVFSANCHWLKRVRFMFLEIHPGCWQTVFHALDSFSYDGKLSGENIRFDMQNSNCQKAVH